MKKIMKAHEIFWKVSTVKDLRKYLNISRKNTILQM